MKKIKYIFISFLFFVFTSNVYAFSYDAELKTDNTLVNVGTLNEIKLSLKDIKGTNDGIFVCSFGIVTSENIILNDVRTLNQWTLSNSETNYLLDTGNPAKNNQDVLVIAVKVNGEGYVEINNIVCTDSEEETQIQDKKINFTIKKEENKKEENKKEENNPIVEDEEIKKSSNCNLADLELSEGEIDFASNVTDYVVSIDNLENVDVIPKLDSTLATYKIDKSVNKIVITVTAEDGSVKIYTINSEKDNNEVIKQEEKNENYTVIFIIIIVLLLLLNVFRVVKNRKK